MNPTFLNTEHTHFNAVLGPKVEPKPTPASDPWQPYKPGLQRHRDTGQLRTDLPMPVAPAAPTAPVVPPAVAPLAELDNLRKAQLVQMYAKRLGLPIENVPLAEITPDDLKGFPIYDGLQLNPTKWREGFPPCPGWWNAASTDWLRNRPEDCETIFSYFDGTTWYCGGRTEEDARTPHCRRKRTFGTSVTWRAVTREWPAPRS